MRRRRDLVDPGANPAGFVGRGRDPKFLHDAADRTDRHVGGARQSGRARRGRSIEQAEDPECRQGTEYGERGMDTVGQSREVVLVGKVVDVLVRDPQFVPVRVDTGAWFDSTSSRNGSSSARSVRRIAAILEGSRPVPVPIDRWRTPKSA